MRRTARSSSRVTSRVRAFERAPSRTSRAVRAALCGERLPKSEGIAIMVASVRIGQFDSAYACAACCDWIATAGARWAARVQAVEAEP